MKHVSIVDKNGFCISRTELQDENGTLITFELREGEQIVEKITNVEFIKPKWNFEKEKWTEGATEEEIKEWEEQNKPLPKEPSETDLLKIELAENTKDLAKKDLEIEQLQKDIADITKQLAVGGNI